MNRVKSGSVKSIAPMMLPEDAPVCNVMILNAKPTFERRCFLTEIDTPVVCLLYAYLFCLLSFHVCFMSILS